MTTSPITIYGTRSQKHRKKTKKSDNSQETIIKLKKERNKLRNDLRRTKKSGMDNNCIKALAANFHQFLRNHGRLKKLQERKSTQNGSQRMC